MAIDCDSSSVDSDFGFCLGDTNMKLIDVTKKFATEDNCLDYIESMRWPNGEIGCVHCGEMGRISKIQREAGKNKRTRIYQCLACKKQFSATSGTIFNDTHLPLTKWFMAIALICEAKKGMSAMQVQRHLGVNYRTAWHLCHRIREAMQEGGELSGLVEADETFFRPRKPRKGNPKVKNPNRMAVLGMIERGGKLRLIPVADDKMVSVEPHLRKHIATEALLQTDSSFTHGWIGRYHFIGRHRMINHIISYAEGENHTQGVENAFSLLKRGIYGTYHQVSIKHLARYCNEFSYRFNRRGEQLAMFDVTLKNLTRGEVLSYKKLTSQVSET
jgi:transposase-like protein